MANALDALFPENADAWQVFHQIATRFVVDAGLAGAVFQRLTDDCSRDDVEDLVDRLSLIYDIVQPEKRTD